MIGRGELREGRGVRGRCKQHIKHMFFYLLQLLRGFLYWKDHFKKTQEWSSTYPALLNIKSVGSHILLLSVTIRCCHSFRSYKVQSWKTVYISRRCQIAEKDNNCVNFWCRKSPGKLDHVPTSNKTDSFSILDLFYVKIKFLNERNCSKKRCLIKIWYNIGRCRL